MPHKAHEIPAQTYRGVEISASIKSSLKEPEMLAWFFKVGGIEREVGRYGDSIQNQFGRIDELKLFADSIVDGKAV